MPLPKSKSAWEIQKRKEAVAMLKTVLKKIEKGEFEIITSGWWTSDGHSIFRVDVVDNPDNQDVHKHNGKLLGKSGRS